MLEVAVTEEPAYTDKEIDMTTTTLTTAGQTTRSQGSGATGTRRVRGLAVATAVVSTSVLYLGAKAAGTDFTLTAPGNPQPHPLILPEIAVFALVFSLLGWGSLALLERFTRHAKVIWSVLATAVLLLSFVPIGIEHATTDTKIMLGVIHLAVAAALLPLLRTRRSGAHATTSGPAGKR